MTKPDFHLLRRGDALRPYSVQVTADEVRAYLAATGAGIGPWRANVPPLALEALLLAGLMDEVPLPDGAVHVAQEVESVAAVSHGEPVEARLTIAQQSVRQGTNVVVFASEVWSGDRIVMRGRSTVMAPMPALAEGAS